MKRILVSLFAICLVLSMTVFSASAAESYELIPLGSTWTKTDNGGASVTITEDGDTIVFAGSVPDTWPCAETYYDSDKIVTANIDEYSLVYDFTVSGGNTNINFRFTDGFGGSETYTIANNTLGDVNYDAGSGDLCDGDYKGAIKLSDFVNSTAFLNEGKFNSKFITEDNEIIFTGIQVYSVHGATITVRALDIVANEDVQLPEDTSSEAPAESESESVAVSEAESVAVSETESKTESKTESATESVAGSEAESVPTDEASEGLGIWLYVIIGVAVVAVVAVVFVLAKKKK